MLSYYNLNQLNKTILLSFFITRCAATRPQIVMFLALLIFLDPETQKEIASYTETAKMKRSYKKNETRSSGNEPAEELRKVIEQL